MAETCDAHLTRPSPWDGVMKPGSLGNVNLGVPILVRPLTNVSSVSVIARKGASVSGLKIPDMGRWIDNGDMRVASDGLGQWRVSAQDKPEGALYRKIKDAVGTTASVIDQSHGWVTIEISGEAAPDVLAKGSSIDFHLDSFGTGQCAATQIHHMMVHLTCLDNSGPTYSLQMFRSMAGSFAIWLRDSAAEFGCKIE